MLCVFHQAEEAAAEREGREVKIGGGECANIRLYLVLKYANDLISKGIFSLICELTEIGLEIVENYG